MLYRVACVNDSYVHPCAFTNILPDDVNCPRPGKLMELLFYLLISVDKNAQLIGIPSGTYVFSNNHSKNSVMDNVYTGKADITLPFMWLTHRRAQELPFLPMSLSKRE